MNEQIENGRSLIEFNNRPKFNWALFLGLCIVALAIYSAGVRIAAHMPHSLQGHFSGSLMAGSNPDREFMSEWEAAAFLSMGHDEFLSILNSGELEGTYTVFQVERMVWGRPFENYDEWSVTVNRDEIVEVPQRMDYDIVTADHRIFSRERLTEWLLHRIDN
ncbi:MAG: hypothetical protein FWE29_06075 [Defluviitaleaceae bacterium]|nr:hypothetical protein [Defluviitaleaceae bacterium]